MAGSEVGVAAPSGLLTRTVVGVLLIAVALGAVYAGGTIFTALVAAAVLLMFAEWCVMHGIGRGFRLAGLVWLAGVIALTTIGPVTQAVLSLGAGAGLLGLFTRGYDRRRAFWMASGILYCGLPAIALLWLRALPANGAGYTGAVLVIVWATDIGAFFAGRAIGGPKLAPAISPNKTWAGAIGGVLAAILMPAFAATAQIRPPGIGLQMEPIIELALIGGLLGIVAVLGDLFESWLKRRAGVKDSGTLLPGHGGVLDRLDGLVPVSIVAALIVAWLSATA